MHDEVSCEPVSSRLATHRLSQQRDANETEIKSLRFKPKPNDPDQLHQFEQRRAANHATRQQMASDIVANNSEEVDQETTPASSKRLSQHEHVVKMEQKPQQQQEGSEQNEQVNGHCEKQRAASVCAGCSGPIRDKFIFSVIDLLWHQDCVQCADCSLKLHERCFTFNGKLYCRHDYWHRFGPKCFACHQAINKSELVQRIKGNRVYHLKCFTCSQCNRLLECGEQLHLIDDKQLLCRQDYQQLGLSSGSCRNQKQQQQQQQQKSPQSQRSNGSNKNGFLQQESASNANSNSSNNNNSYFTLLSQNQVREPQDRVATTKAKRGSLTSLDNMQDERLEPEPDEEAADEVDDEDELMERDLEELQQDEVDEEGDEEVESRHLFGRAENMDLENEENRTAGAAAGSQQLEVNGNNNNNKPAAASANCSTANKRRRRRKRAASRQDKESSALVGANNRNSKGQSILNGSGGQSASILANMQAIGQASSGGSSLKCFSSSSTSSSSSTASNHSTSSGSQSRRSSNHLAAGSAASRGAAATQQQHHQHHHQSHPTQQSQHPGIQQQVSSNNNSNSNEHQSAAAGHKPTRVRTVLNEKQLQTLRDCYAMNPRPDAIMKEQLVDMTGLSSRVIRVWFQNKRCKDKKKSILYKQMQQHEKDGRHLAGLTHIRGVPLVASSPIQYQEEHSSLHQKPGDSPQQSVQSPTQLSVGGPQQAQDSPGVDIHTYQPPWKSLIEYAHQQQQQQPAAAAAALKQQAVGTQPAPPPDRLNTTSPRYQQLISQMHGYGHPANSSEPLPDHQVLEQQPAPGPGPQYSQPSLMLGHQQSPTGGAGPAASNPHYPVAGASPLMQLPLAHHHIHAHLTQMGGGPQAPPASHHLHQFQH